MAEPASSTAGIAIAAGAITLTGSIFGVAYDSLLAGFFGGLVALSYLPAMSLRRIAGSVVSSSLLAGWFAPLLTVTAMNYFPYLSGVGDGGVRMASGAALGLCGQFLIPALLGRLIRKIGGQA